jgi:multiple sugar transport system substrate-binding protein
MIKKRAFAGFVAAAVASALALTGCNSGGSQAQGDADGNVTIRMAWWGSDDRAKVTTDAVKAFEAANPNIKVQLEPGSFSGYFDKLATQVAANDAPDVIQMVGDQIQEYAGRGALLDLSSIDTSKMEESSLAPARLDGKLYGISAGVGTHTMIANPALFEAAGVQFPDDRTWTWEDFERISREITEKSPEGTFGSQAFGTDINGLAIWLGQKGKSLWTSDGKVGYEASDSADYFEMLLRMSKEGGLPTASLASEAVGGPLEQSGMATGKYATGYWGSNQLTSLVAAGGQDLKPIRFPSRTGKAEDANMMLASTQYWSIAGRSKNVEAAKKLVDFLSNSKEAGGYLLAGRGVPANSEVADAILDKLGPADRTAAEFLKEISPETADAPPAAPVGGGDIQNVLRRIAIDVLFERMSPEQAAQQLIDETKSALR